MRNLPVPVSDDDIEEMFEAIDKNEDDKLSYKEFRKMINPPDVPHVQKPHISSLGMRPQTFNSLLAEDQGAYRRQLPSIHPRNESVSIYSLSNVDSLTNMSSV